MSNNTANTLSQSISYRLCLSITVIFSLPITSNCPIDLKIQTHQLNSLLGARPGHRAWLARSVEPPTTWTESRRPESPRSRWRSYLLISFFLLLSFVLIEPHKPPGSMLMEPPGSHKQEPNPATWFSFSPFCRQWLTRSVINIYDCTTRSSFCQVEERFCTKFAEKS